MCGIAGIIKRDRQNLVSVEELKVMTDVIHHRGPDQEGFYNCNNVGLGFRRLSIIDLSTGNQPIPNENQTIWVIMNGEIYNYKELRNDLILRGHKFRTSSDTEVLVHLYEEFGLDMLTKLRGMYAFSIFDQNKEKLYLVRDRIGIKPCYYYLDQDQLMFGSEIKQLKIQPSRNLRINDKAALDYFTYGYMLRDRTIYDKIKRLLPAHYMEIDTLNFNFNIKEYWSITASFNHELTESEWIEKIRAKLDENVSSHLMSDVPLGAFLSGGVDSSGVVATMAKMGNSRIKTFAIGFKEEEYNELKYAKRVSELFNTEHNELILESGSVSIIDKIIDMYDEPFADSSAIPTYFVSQFASGQVKVVLSGDGGDELFAGYNNYVKYNSFIKKYGNIGHLGRAFSGALNSLIPNYFYGKGYTHLLSKKANHLIAYSSIFKEYEVKSVFTSDFIHNLSGYSSFNAKTKLLDEMQTGDTVAKFQLLDLKTYMVDDILTKVDRASMASSIEARVPLLDHEFVELAFQIPTRFKLSDNQGKLIFKKALEDRLPNDILYRKKKGFSVPLTKWFNSDLNQLIHDELLNNNSPIQKYIKRDAINDFVKNHSKGKRDFSSQIWAMLYFNQWYKRNL